MRHSLLASLRRLTLRLGLASLMAIAGFAYLAWWVVAPVADVRTLRFVLEFDYKDEAAIETAEILCDKVNSGLFWPPSNTILYDPQPNPRLFELPDGAMLLVRFDSSICRAPEPGDLVDQNGQKILPVVEWYDDRLDPSQGRALISARALRAGYEGVVIRDFRISEIDIWVRRPELATLRERTRDYYLHDIPKSVQVDTAGFAVQPLLLPLKVNLQTGPLAAVLADLASGHTGRFIQVSNCLPWLNELPRRAPLPMFGRGIAVTEQTTGESEDDRFDFERALPLRKTGPAWIVDEDMPGSIAISFPIDNIVEIEMERPIRFPDGSEVTLTRAHHVWDREDRVIYRVNGPFVSYRCPEG